MFNLFIYTFATQAAAQHYMLPETPSLVTLTQEKVHAYSPGWIAKNASDESIEYPMCSLTERVKTVSLLEVQAYLDAHGTSGMNFLGRGISKEVFVHKDLPGWVIKTASSEGLIRNYENLNLIRERLRNFPTEFDRVVLPESHLYSTSRSLVIIEQRFDLIKKTPFYKPVGQELAAIKQFELFTQVTGLCDVALSSPNSAILVGTNPPKIGVIDFDCINPDVNARIWA